MKTLVLLVIFVSLALPTPTNAAQTTSSPSAEIQAKLKSLKEEIASKATKFKIDVSKKLQNRSQVGYIKSKTDSSILLATKNGTLIVSLTEDTQYQNKGKTKPSLNNFNTEDYVAAIGDFDDTGTLTAKRIIKLITLPEERKIIYGQIVSESTQSATIQSKDNKKYLFNKTAKTSYKTVKNQDILPSEIKVGSKIILVGTKPAGGELQARSIYLISYSPKLKRVLPTATPTIILSPTKTAAVKSTTPTKKPAVKKAP